MQIDIMYIILGGILSIAGLIGVIYAIGWNINHNTYPVPRIHKPQFLGIALALQSDVRVYAGWDKWFRKRVKVKNWDKGTFNCLKLPSDSYHLCPGDTILMRGRWNSVLVLVVLGVNEPNLPVGQYQITTIHIGSISNVHR